MHLPAFYMQLPAIFVLKNIIKYVVWSIFKLKSTAFYSHHLVFLHSLQFHQLCVDKGRFDSTSCSTLSNFCQYLDVVFTHTVSPG